jgi:7,8-dihydropterin-6-yl-methyl-4-(beta-D-ribofuranosyl)aminobenzene 5'-phosphate synthase
MKPASALNQIRITTLCDNCAARMDVLAEWGLSMLIETPTVTILFDTGYSATCVHNAKILGKDLSRINKIVLSHGHLDHVGGLLPILKSINCDLYTEKPQIIDVIAHPDIFQAKYSLTDKNTIVWAGMLTSRDLLENNGASFKLSTTPYSLADNICTTGEVLMQTKYEQLDKNLIINQGGKHLQDQLADDQALIIRTSQGLVIVLGCSHRGIINTLLCARKITNENRIYMVLGGTHLFAASVDRIQKTIVALQDLGVQKIGVSHCTGLLAAAKLADAFGDNFFFNTVGTQIEFNI